ncbi:MRN complex-interacting protein isoform X3 [Physeter macrocephalus]|uniref:MRN complex-interacting protein isoform X3 n=1 Tax=Physeter macrocephalus TaxID=9755 RepID=A0A2Y9FAN9_PHYMC|nr:MRN complex-interacting protein isoform X3 [Physeter catodon]|eukprot:XP_007118639.1 MRN complex-interacting protein isoform X3 [Physeter catodon]
MAPSQRFRVLRCSCCRLFQAHQVKKSLKWTCKACGEKQSFLRAYGEGSGADCRHHVQKLNLLQGQISEMSLRGQLYNLSLRSLEESINANEEENARPRQAVPASLQEKLQPSKNRWLKYLERDSKELQLEEGGVCFNRQPSSKREKPDPPFSTGLPRKRKWSQSTVQPPFSPNVQDSRNCEVTLKSLKDHTGLTGKVKEGSSREDWDTRELVIPRGKPPCPAQQVRTMSPKWEQFLPPLGNSSHLDTEPLTPLQRGGPRPARAAQTEQGTPRTQTPREGGLCRTPGALQPPQATHTPMPGPKRLCGKTPEQSGGTGPWAEGGPLIKGMQEPSSLVRLCDLFKTGEDFDDDL